MQTKTVTQLNNFHDVTALPDVANLIHKHQVDRDDLISVIQRIKKVRSNVLVSALLSQLVDTLGGNLQFYTKAILSEDQVDQYCDKILQILDESYWAKLVDILQFKQIFDYRVTYLIFSFGQPEQSSNKRFTKQYGFINAEFSVENIKRLITFIGDIFSPHFIKAQFELTRHLITHEIQEGGDIQIHLKPNTQSPSGEEYFIIWAYALIKQYHPNNWVDVVSARSSDHEGVVTLPGMSFGVSNAGVYSGGVSQQSSWIKLDIQFRTLLENILGTRFE